MIVCYDFLVLNRQDLLKLSNLVWKLNIYIINYILVQNKF